MGGKTKQIVDRAEEVVKSLKRLSPKSTLNPHKLSSQGKKVIEKTQGAIAKPVHKNSLQYVGDTHIYVIRDESGKILKYRESAMGKNKVGQPIRGQLQARKLMRQNPGQEYKSEVIRDFSSKAEARVAETRYITTHKKVLGDQALQLHKTTH